jgi:hypothetical protein
MSLRKTVEREKAHAIFRTPDGLWTWYVLKVYAGPAGEKKNGFARWFCLVTSPYVGDTGEFGDTYIHEITYQADLIRCTQEWADAYDIPVQIGPGVTAVAV